MITPINYSLGEKIKIKIIILKIRFLFVLKNDRFYLKMAASTVKTSQKLNSESHKEFIFNYYFFK